MRVIALPTQALLGGKARRRARAPADVKRDFGTASILRDGRVVFNIGGNEYERIHAPAV